MVFTAISAAIQAPKPDADHGEILEVELIEQVEIEIRQIVDRAHALGQFGTAIARMGRRDDARVLGEFVDSRRGRLDAVLGVEEKQRRARTLFDQIDPRAIDDKRLRLTR